MGSPKSSPASGGGVAVGNKIAVSRLPQDSSDRVDESRGGTSAEVWPRRKSGNAQSVVMRSSAGQEWESSRSDGGFSE